MSFLHYTRYRQRRRRPQQQATEIKHSVPLSEQKNPKRNPRGKISDHLGGYNFIFNKKKRGTILQAILGLWLFPWARSRVHIGRCFSVASRKVGNPLLGQLQLTHFPPSYLNFIKQKPHGINYKQIAPFLD